MVEAQTSKPKCSEHVVPEAPPVTQAHSSDARILFAARTSAAACDSSMARRSLIFDDHRELMHVAN